MVLIFVLAISSISCEKEKIEAISKVQVEESIHGTTSDGKMLIFESVESYVSAINNLSGEKIKAIISQNSNLQFNNYFSKQNTSVDSSEQEMDEVFGQLLNEDGVIQIGKHIFKINMAMELVFVISVDDKETNYQELISGNTESGKVFVYSFDDDVLQIVNEGISEKCSGVRSGIYWSYGAMHEAPIINTLDDGRVFRLNPFVRYFKAGIFFKLSSGYEIWRFGSSISTLQQSVSGNLGLGLSNIEVFCRYPQGWYKRKPCGGGTVIGTQAGGYYYSASTYNHKQTFYSGIRGLNGYYF